MSTCKNCGYQVDLKYCPNCGQKESVKRIELKWLFQELPHAVWHLEKGFLYNVTELFKRPGYAIKDYLEGRRKKFYHPVSYLMIILGVMYIVMHYLHVHWYDPSQDAWMSKGKTELWKKYDRSQQLWTGRYIFFMLFYLPGAAFIFWAWLKIMKRNYNYAEGLVISFFSTAQMIIPQVIGFALAAFINRTAFTRLEDLTVNNGMAFLLFVFQFYQLGNPALKRKWRIVFAILGAILIETWVFGAMNIFSKIIT
jgi:hypothetical protein